MRGAPVANTLLPVLNRIFFILLMLILPLQTVWAAASAYCQHEQGTAAQHFGHHAHQHQAASNDSGSGPSSNFHADCSFCHLGAIGVVASSLDVTSPAFGCAAVSWSNNFLLSVFLEGPERPDWASAV